MINNLFNGTFHIIWTYRPSYSYSVC